MRTGQSFTVTFHVSKVGGTTAGYQSEVLFDPTRVVPTSIIQGPYLKFKTFFGSPTAFKGMIRIGALNFPIPTTLPKGAGSGVLATATFRALKSGPVNLDMGYSMLSAPGGAYSIKGTRKDLAVQVTATGDILAASGRPNPGGTMQLEVYAPTYAGKNVITAASFSNTGIPLGSGVTVPIGVDILLDLALANAYPFTNSNTKLDSVGRAVTSFSVPNDPRAIGIRIHFGSLILNASPLRFLKASNPTSVLYIKP